MSVTGVNVLRSTEARLARWPAPLVIISFVIVGLGFAAALLSPLIVPHAEQQNLMIGITKPRLHHLLGTDQLGRDVLALLVAGARTSVLGPLEIAIGSVLLGDVIGLVSGYFGGWIDGVAMRWVDLMFSLPALLVAIVVTGIAGSTYTVAVIVLIVLFAPGDARVVRGAVLDQRHRPYIEAARLSNLSARRIMTMHLWPNVAPIALANGFLDFAFALVSLASLSFLGLGVGPGSPDWGRTLANNAGLLQANPWAAVAPGLAIILMAAAMNLLGDWAFDRLQARGLER
jgi:peptide/nickel transport system permease protein